MLATDTCCIITAHFRYSGESATLTLRPAAGLGAHPASMHLDCLTAFGPGYEFGMAWHLLGRTLHFMPMFAYRAP